MTTVTVKLPESLSRSLEHEARRRGLSKSAVIRESLERTLAESREKGDGSSCLDLVADLVGIFDGPSDSSTNKEYLMEALESRYERDERNQPPSGDPGDLSALSEEEILIPTTRRFPSPRLPEFPP